MEKLTTTGVVSNTSKNKSAARQVVWEGHMKSPTATLEEALRRTEHGAAMAQSSLQGGAKREHPVFSERVYTSGVSVFSLECACGLLVGCNSWEKGCDGGEEDSVQVSLVIRAN